MSTTGEPCWIQLSTDDVDTAISFYGDLFGWSAGEPSEEYQRLPDVLPGRPADRRAGADA